jgi:phosphatidylglycerol:prolipoprotein diacylglycerol transferase
MLLGMSITRAGCFLNGCCSGRPTCSRWGINMPDHRGVWQRRIPSQLLEAVWGLSVLAGAVALWGRFPFEGAVFLYALGSYGVGRIVLESLRDRPDRILGHSVHKAISVGIVGVSVCAFIMAWPH